MRRTEYPVRVMMLSWEYPPRLVGGIARHVQELSEALAAQGVQVHVITATHPDAPDEAVENGVHLHRVGAPPPLHGDFLQGVWAMNAAFEARADALIRDLLSGKPAQTQREPILLHAHDWLVHPARRANRHRVGHPVAAQRRVPTVATARRLPPRVHQRRAHRHTHDYHH